MQLGHQTGRQRAAVCRSRYDKNIKNVNVENAFKIISPFDSELISLT